MSCDCAKFEPIRLDRGSITQRIKESRAIRKRLTVVTEHTQLRLFLFRCPSCGQFWQSGHEWNFADKEYLFQVPDIEVTDWLNHPYRQPAAMMIYSAVLARFCDQSKFEPTDSPCHFENCLERAVKMSVFCLRHHIESLQKVHLLPPTPIGRLFPPYFEDSSPAST